MPRNLDALPPSARPLNSSQEEYLRAHGEAAGEAQWDGHLESEEQWWQVYFGLEDVDIYEVHEPDTLSHNYYYDVFLPGLRLQLEDGQADPEVWERMQEEGSFPPFPKAPKPWLIPDWMEWYGPEQEFREAFQNYYDPLTMRRIVNKVESLRQRTFDLDAWNELAEEMGEMDAPAGAVISALAAQYEEGSLTDLYVDDIVAQIKDGRAALYAPFEPGATASGGSRGGFLGDLGAFRVVGEEPGDDDPPPDQDELYDNITIYDSRDGGYEARQARRRIAGGDWDYVIAAIARWMEANQYWPSLYYVNERGNVDLLDEHGAIVRSWV